MHSLFLPILAVVALCMASAGGNYQLNWSHTGVAGAAPKHQNAPPAPVARDRLPVLSPAPPSRPAPAKPVAVPPRDLRVAARQFFDYEKNRYIVVDRILTTVYRRGRYHSETHYNVAQYSQVDLTLKALRPGDRYQIEIFWDDGSRRWFDQTVGVQSSRHLYVDGPDPFSR